MTVSRTIRNRIASINPGSVFCANDFTDLGKRGNIDVVLHRLSEKGFVRQLGYGLYDLPRKSTLPGDLSQQINDIIDAYSRKMDQCFVLDPLNAANALGVTNQVPTKLTFLTNGKSHTLHIQGIDINLIHASPKIMTGSTTSIGTTIQALRYFGAKGAPDKAIKLLAKRLSNDDLNTLLTLKNHVLRNLIPQIDSINLYWHKSLI